MGRRRKKLRQPDVGLDLTPMIDVIFLLIIFFILAGRITADITNEMITVPPTKTAEKFEKPDDTWRLVKIEVWGDTMDRGDGGQAGHVISIGTDTKLEATGSTGPEAFTAYQGLRDILDEIYDRADKYPDPKETGLNLPKVIIELRADADTEYRVVQEIQQVATDSIDPYPNDNGDFMTPMQHPSMDAAKPFVLFHYTTRRPGE